MTIQKNNAASNTPQPRPLQVTPKAQSSGDPNEIIDRKYVAGSLDRPGNDGSAPDGVISDGEFSKAGLQVDQAARDIINRGGEQGDKITVNELSKALSDNTVNITGDGNVRIVDGFASFTNGRVQQAQPWTFPDIPGLRVLARVVDLAPTYGDGLDPNNPGYQYTETRTRYRGTYRQGDSLGSGEYVADSNGRELSADANGQYPSGAQVWQRYTVVHWDDMRDALLSRAREISYETSDARDPEIQQIHSTVSRLVSDLSWNGGSSEDQARRLYSGMSYISNINVPMSPKARMGGMDDSINAAKTALNDHFKILQQVPIERARDVVSQEVNRLKAPVTPAKGIGAALGGLLGGGGLFGLAAGGAIALSGGALIGAAVGAGVLGLGLGWLVGKLINDGRAKEVQADLKTLETISPEKNKQDLQQYSMQAYKLLQDARTVTSLAKVRSYDEDAHGVQNSVDSETGKIREQANQLRDIQKLVDKYANK